MNAQAIQGEIIKGNKTTEDGSFYVNFPIKATAGQKILVKMAADGFKPAFDVGKIKGGSFCNKCSTGHKYGDNGVATIFYMQENMPVQIRASTMHPGDTGKFTLYYKVIDPKPLEVRPIKLGEQINDAISADDGLKPSDIFYDATLRGNYDLYSLDLKAGQNIQIYAASNTDIPEVRFYRMGHDPYHLAWEQVGSANGKGDAIIARFKVPYDDKYYFSVSNNPIEDISIADPTIDGKINYNLLVSPSSALSPKIIPRITSGYQVNSTFDKNIDLIPSRRGQLVAKDYVLTPQAGKNYWITAQSKDTDVSVWLGKKSAFGEFNLYQSDDDNAGGTGAKLLYQSKSNEPVDIRLFSNYGLTEHQKKTLAEYSFSVKEMTRPPTPLNGKFIKTGDRVFVQLKDGGYRNELDALYAIFRTELKAGEQVTIFTEDYQGIPADTFLEIGTGTPTAFKPLAQDEDNGAGYNAKIKFTTPQDGYYYIRASATNIAHEDSFYLNMVPTVANPAPPIPTELTIGIETGGEINKQSPIYGDGDAPYNDFIFNGTKGKKYKIQLAADGFYPNIQVRQFSALNGKFTQSKDNTIVSPPIITGTQNNSLEYVPPEDGPILVRIESAQDDKMGKFTISVNEQ